MIRQFDNHLLSFKVNTAEAFMFLLALASGPVPTQKDSAATGYNWISKQDFTLQAVALGFHFCNMTTKTSLNIEF